MDQKVYLFAEIMYFSESTNMHTYVALLFTSTKYAIKPYNQEIFIWICSAVLFLNIKYIRKNNSWISNLKSVVGFNS